MGYLQSPKGPYCVIAPNVLKVSPNVYIDKPNKFLLCTLFGTLLGHILCKDGFLVDPAKVVAIVNLEA